MRAHTPTLAWLMRFSRSSTVSARSGAIVAVSVPLRITNPWLRSTPVPPRRSPRRVRGVNRGFRSAVFRAVVGYVPARPRSIALRPPPMSATVALRPSPSVRTRPRVPRLTVRPAGNSALSRATRSPTVAHPLKSISFRSSPTVTMMCPSCTPRPAAPPRSLIRVSAVSAGSRSAAPRTLDTALNSSRPGMVKAAVEPSLSMAVTIRLPSPV